MHQRLLHGIQTIARMEKIPKDNIPNGHNSKWTPFRMGTISNRHNPEWTQSRVDTIPNGYDPEWTQSQMDMIPNKHNPEWAPTCKYSYL